MGSETREALSDQGAVTERGGAVIRRVLKDGSVVDQYDRRAFEENEKIRLEVLRRLADSRPPPPDWPTVGMMRTRGLAGRLS